VQLQNKIRDVAEPMYKRTLQGMKINPYRGRISRQRREQARIDAPALTAIPVRNGWSRVVKIIHKSFLGVRTL